MIGGKINVLVITEDGLIQWNNFAGVKIPHQANSSGGVPVQVANMSGIYRPGALVTAPRFVSKCAIFFCHVGGKEALYA